MFDLVWNGMDFIKVNKSGIKDLSTITAGWEVGWNVLLQWKMSCPPPSQMHKTFSCPPSNAWKNHMPPSKLHPAPANPGHDCWQLPNFAKESMPLCTYSKYATFIDCYIICSLINMWIWYLNRSNMFSNMLLYTLIKCRTYWSIFWTKTPPPLAPPIWTCM